MNAELGILIATAFLIGFLHTILGPDHYLPFVAIARSSRWSAKKTLGMTALCGFGHVFVSVAIGSIGLLMGTMLMQFQTLDSYRSDSAAWLLIGFGLAYLVWGMVRAVRATPHEHLHTHGDGTIHSHVHAHDPNHCHVHDQVEIKAEGGVIHRTLTPWVLFLIFAFGPCEALIPLMMYPVADSNFLAVAAIVLAFATATIGTMLAAVMLIIYGFRLIKLPNSHRFSHAFAGLTIFVCGVLVMFGA